MSGTNISRTLDSHHRLAISFIFGLVSFIFLPTYFDLTIRVIAAWDIFVLVDIGLAWFVIIRKNAEETVKNAKLQDSSRSTILFFLTTAAIISLIAIALLLKIAKHSEQFSANSILFLALVTVGLSWALVHTIFTIHYSHIYYSDENGKHKRGIIFPHDNEPTFLDFAYFSFVVGMTFQVSDVVISSKRIRKLCLMHGVISFLFNTFILAIAINIIAGML